MGCCAPAIALADFDCPNAKCEFGTLRGPIATLADLNAMGVRPPPGICGQPIAAVVFGATLPPGCGPGFGQLQADFAAVCNATVTDTYVGICGSTQGEITAYLVAYAILYTFVLLLSQ